jgi:hypothetical protein
MDLHNLYAESLLSEYVLAMNSPSLSEAREGTGRDSHRNVSDSTASLGGSLSSQIL